MNEREKALRTKRAQLATEARSILDNGPKDAALSAEDESRYQGLMDEFDKLGDTLAAFERQAKAEAEGDRSLDEPTRPDPEDRAGGRKKTVRAVATPEYRNEFRNYLGTGVQGRALQMDADTSGGFVVAPQEFSDQIIKFVDNEVFIRNLATKHRVPNAASLGVPQLTADPDDADWTTELATGNEDSSMAFGKREFRPQPLAKLVKISNKLIRAAGQLTQFSEDGDGDGAMSVEGLVGDRLGYKFSVSQEKAFLTGSGNLQPLGVFTASADGIPTSSDVPAASTTVFTADELINVKYSLKPQYIKSKTTAWLFHRDAVKAIRKLKDQNQQYIWAPGAIGLASLAVGSPDKILDLPFYMSEYAPNTFTAALYVGILGDWRYYWIADALDLTVQRLVELYARTNQVGYIGRLETDGMPVLGEAFARLILHA